MIAVIDYGVGNIGNVQNALRRLDADFTVASEPRAIEDADGIILPGVGAFESAMRKLAESALDGAIKAKALDGTPILGICLGMQLLFDRSEENNGCAGLGLISGDVVRFKKAPKVPHVGWNDIVATQDCALFSGLGTSKYVYFVHSYHCVPDDENVRTAVAKYGEEFVAIIKKGNIFGVQFHPEKSGEIGLRIMDNFINFEVNKCK